MDLKELIEEVQNDVADLIVESREIECDLQCAESCETLQDIADNVWEARKRANDLALSLLALHKKCMKRLDKDF